MGILPLETIETRAGATETERSGHKLGSGGTKQGPVGARDGGPAQMAGDETAGFDEEGKVDAGVHAKTVQHVEHVFACDVPRGAGRVGAAAEARDRAIDGGDSELERGEHIRERLAVSVMKVNGEFFARSEARERSDQVLHLAGRALADRLAERDFVAAHGEKALRRRG